MIVHCQRCHVPCRAGAPDPKARLLQESAGPKGLCVNCAVTQFFKDEKYGISLEHVMRGSDLDGKPGREITKSLLMPHVQEQFGAILRAGFAQVAPTEIDWLEVVANWDLPFDRRTIRPRKEKK